MPPQVKPPPKAASSSRSPALSWFSLSSISLNGGGRDRCGLDEDGSGARGGEAGGVRDDVVDGVGGDLAGVDRDVRYQRAVEEGLVAEVCVSRLSRSGVGHGSPKIGVAVADLNDGRVVAVNLNHGRLDDGRRGPLRELRRLIRHSAQIV